MWVVMARSPFSRRSLLARSLLLTTVVAVALGATSVAHGAAESSARQARQLSTGCEPNGLPGSVAVCKGTGRLNVRLTGTAVLTVQNGRVTVKGKAQRVCKLKRVKRKNGRRVIRRVCTKRARPILPRGKITRKARGYRIYIGRRLYFYLPAGTWRVSAEGTGLSLSAVGEGRAGVVSRTKRNDPDAAPGLISVGGQIYDKWPRRWTKYDFGPDIKDDDEQDERVSSPSSAGRRSSPSTDSDDGSTTILVKPGDTGDSRDTGGSGEAADSEIEPENSPEPDSEDEKANGALNAAALCSSDALLPSVPGWRLLRGGKPCPTK